MYVYEDRSSDRNTLMNRYRSTHIDVSASIDRSLCLYQCLYLYLYILSTSQVDPRFFSFSCALSISYNSHDTMMKLMFTPERPPHSRTAQAQPPAAYRRRHSRPHHHRRGEHSPTARQPHSNGLCSLTKEGPGPEKKGVLLGVCMSSPDTFHY